MESQVVRPGMQEGASRRDVFANWENQDLDTPSDRPPGRAVISSRIVVGLITVVSVLEWFSGFLHVSTILDMSPPIVLIDFHGAALGCDLKSMEANRSAIRAISEFQLSGVFFVAPGAACACAVQRRPRRLKQANTQLAWVAQASAEFPFSCTQAKTLLSLAT